MSSCFLCDLSCSFNQWVDRYVSTGLPNPVQTAMYMQQFAIIKGSAVDKSATMPNNITYTDQQHTNNAKQNYVSYCVKKIEFEMTTDSASCLDLNFLNDYVVIFKVPYKVPVVDFGFYDMKYFILYKQPECVLGYKIVQNYTYYPQIDGHPQQDEKPFKPRQYKIVVDKPFVLGPNDYVGVFYMFNHQRSIFASAKVWFDVL